MTRTKCPRKGTRMQYFGPDTRLLDAGDVVKVALCVNDTVYVKVKGESELVGVEKDSLQKKILKGRALEQQRALDFRDGYPTTSPGSAMSDEERMHMGLRGLDAEQYPDSGGNTPIWRFLNSAKHTLSALRTRDCRKAFNSLSAVQSSFGQSEMAHGEELTEQHFDLYNKVNQEFREKCLRGSAGLRGIETVGLSSLGSNDTYNYYVVRDGLVVGGFEFKEDAQDSAADEPSPSKVFHKSKIPMQDRQKFHADNFVMEKLGGLGADAEKRKPVTHSYPGYSTTEMYNLTQTNDAIRDGDLFICNKGETVGFLMQAWPTLLWGELGALEKAKSIESFRAEYPETFAAFDAMMLPASKKAP